MNHDGHETRYRIRRLPQWVLEPVKVIRRPYIAELIMASGHMPASKGRTYDCTAPTGSCLHKPLACRAVPHMRQIPFLSPANGSRCWRDGLLNGRLACRDFSHPLLRVLRPRAHNLDVFRTVGLHKICAGNHGLRIECAHHRIVDRRSPHDVNGAPRLAVRMRQRGRANKNYNRIHDRPRLMMDVGQWALWTPSALSHSLTRDELQHGAIAKSVP
jgi:hypothetical protein